MRILLEDLGYAVRQLRNSPGLTSLVVLTLALGIGANTAMFSVENGFHRPLPVRAPEQIVALATESKGNALGLEGIEYRFSYPALADFRKQADTFSDLFAYNMGLGGLSDGGKASQFFYSYVTGNYFSALGIKPAAGRFFLPGEGEKPGAEILLVLGYSCWQKRFGGDAGVIGRRVRVDGKAATVVGVAPKGFRGVYWNTEMDGYVPLNYLTQQGSWDLSGMFSDRHVRLLTVLGRLKPGVSLTQAQSSVDVIARRVADENPATDEGIAVRVLPEKWARPLPLPRLAEKMPFIAGLFLILAGLVLLLACTNVANILLVRAMGRQREMAIRAALGSGRGRLVRQVLTESLLLAFLGGAAGVILGAWASDAMSSIPVETNIPVLLDFSFDWRVFAYALAAALATGIAVGVWPALRASRADVSAVLHDGGRSGSGGAGRHRVRNVLVVAQVAGSLMLLIVAGLFVRGLQRAQRMDLGFDPDRLLNVLLDTSYAGYGKPRTAEFYRELERRVRAIPGVQSASQAFSVPVGYYNDADTVQVEGRPANPGQQPPLVFFNAVDPGYFETMRIPLVGGRGFRESDNETAPRVAIVNQTMASRFWPNQESIGKRFSMMKRGGGAYWEVVGVARDGKYLAAFEPPLPYFYVPLAQRYSSRRALQIRCSVPPESLASRVEREVRELDPEMPISDLRTMRQSLAGALGFFVFRLGAYEAGAMGMLGLALAVVGVYGVVSYAASQRTREIGIRMALGADPGDVRRLVLREGAYLVIAGVLAGLAGAWVLARAITNWLFGVIATDPLTFTGVTVLLAAIALWACYVPARRAMRVDPMVALRHE